VTAPEMSIELLYFDGCPNHEAFLPHLRDLLRRVGVMDEVRLVHVGSLEEAERERFLGSPTLRIDGRDIDPTAASRDDFGFKCRLYRTDSGTRGTPPDEWILDALAGGSGGQWPVPGTEGVPLSPVPGFETRSWAALRTSRLPPAERRVHARIVRALAGGSVPDGGRIDAWAGEEGLTGSHARAALEAADVAHFDAGTGSVRLAYPFSAAPTRHRVNVDGVGASYAMCSLDALGVAFMLRATTRVASSDPVTGELIEITVTPDGQASWSPQEAVAVVGCATDGGASAECMCPNTNFAASVECGRAQLDALAGCSGTVMPIPDAVDAGRQLFATLLTTDGS
jgi:Alkylmercury lyase